jgi:hypothetical protein
MQFPVHFRAGTGMRPHDYVLQQRIERANVVIATERMGLAEVALSVGFQTQSHFSTVFKRLTSETPGQWRGADHQAVSGPTSPTPERWAAAAPCASIPYGVRFTPGPILVRTAAR